MKKNEPKSVELTTIERTFEYDDCTVIWRFNPKKRLLGAYEVEIKHKKPTKKD